MADSLFIVPVQVWVYGMLRNLAVQLWLTDRAALLAGLFVSTLNEWITTELFGPAISEFTLLSQGLLPLTVTLALFLLAFSYLLAPFFRVQVVNPTRAIGWLLFALLFYQAGPGLYVEGEALRRALAGEFYLRAAASAESAGAGTASGPLAVLDEVGAGPDEAMGALENQFGAFVASDQGIDGLDLAMAYLLATGDDVVYAASPLPVAYEAAYFDPDQGGLYFLAMGAEARNDSINVALVGISRLLLAGPILFFGLTEQAIYLALSMAAGVLFLSMSVAVLFAFFERTEALARTLLEMWLELFVLTAILSALQAFLVGLVMLGARTLNPTLTLGAAVLGLPAMAALLLKAVGAIWDALNRMFTAMSGAVGGGLPAPAQLGAQVAGGVAGAALTVATAGAGAALAAGAGASLAQVAGSALSGVDSLYAASALGSFVLPEESPLRASAQGFYEGALSNRMLGPAGALLLAPDAGLPAEPVPTPVPASAAPVVETPPLPAAASQPMATAIPVTETHGAPAVTETAASQSASPGQAMDPSLLAAAIREALAGAPAGGFASSDAALESLRGVLAEQGHQNATVAPAVSHDLWQQSLAAAPDHKEGD